MGKKKKMWVDLEFDNVVSDMQSAAPGLTKVEATKIIARQTRVKIVVPKIGGKKIRKKKRRDDYFGFGLL